MKKNRHRPLFFAALLSAGLVSCDSGRDLEVVQESSKDADDEVDEVVEPRPVLEHVTQLEGAVTFTLEDGEILNKENPDTFWIPALDRRENLKEDDLVKLIFTITDGEKSQGERMWVLVKSGDGSGYTGILDNDPYSTDQMEAGISVSFEPRHVIDIYAEASEEVAEQQ